MNTKVCTDATSLINTEDGDRGESNQADLSRCAWTTSAVDGRVVWLCGGSSSTCSWTLRTWRAALRLPAASFKLALWDSTFTKLIVRSELVEAAGERLIKQNELLRACTRSINARDMHTQCESVPMEASRTAASRLINVWRKRLPQRRHQQQFKTSISASLSVKGK